MKVFSAITITADILDPSGVTGMLLRTGKRVKDAIKEAKEADRVTFDEYGNIVVEKEETIGFK